MALEMHLRAGRRRCALEARTRAEAGCSGASCRCRRNGIRTCASVGLASALPHSAPNSQLLSLLVTPLAGSRNDRLLTPQVIHLSSQVRSALEPAAGPKPPREPRRCAKPANRVSAYLTPFLGRGGDPGREWPRPGRTGQDDLRAACHCTRTIVIDVRYCPARPLGDC